VLKATGVITGLEQYVSLGSRHGIKILFQAQGSDNSIELGTAYNMKHIPHRDDTMAALREIIGQEAQVIFTRAPNSYTCQYVSYGQRTLVKPHSPANPTALGLVVME
jgi:hypothetical protein